MSVLVFLPLADAKCQMSGPPSSPLRTAATPHVRCRGASPPCFWETSWFQASDGDLEFAQWLLSRCTSTGEMMTLESVEAIRRLRILFRMKERLQLEFVRSTERQQPTAEMSLGRWATSLMHCSNKTKVKGPAHQSPVC